MNTILPLLAACYTNKEHSKGIYLLHFDTATETFKEISTVKNEQPSYLALANNGRFFFSANEHGGQFGGTVSAYEYDSAKGLLQTISTQYTNGDHPCYVSVDKTGSWLAAGNYSGGNFSLFRVYEDGSISEAVATIQHFGKGPHENQEKPHVHAVAFSPDNRFLYVCNLGTDGIYVYPFNAASHTPIDQEQEVKIAARQGSGPRHIVFHPLLPVAYVINELGGTLSILDIKKQEIIKELSLTSSGDGDVSAADVHIDPQGRFLYASLRGKYNCINCFAINTASGDLSFAGTVSSGGATPRNFVLSPGGDYLLAANQESDNVTVFKINKANGLPDVLPVQVQLPEPVCLKFL
jgi:6-phosphogluconolactonase